MSILRCLYVFAICSFVYAVLHDELHKLAASREASIAEIQSLINRNVDVNKLTKDGESVLHLACIYGNADKLRLLLSSGANPNQRADKLKASLYMTPMTWCVYGGHADAVELFIEDGRTNVNLIVLKEDDSRITAMDIAYSIGSMGANLIPLLRNAGAKTYNELLIANGGDEEKIVEMPDLIHHMKI